jgi:hypothetical protein
MTSKSMIINKIRKTNTGKRNKFKYFVIITQGYVSVLDVKPIHGVNIYTLRSIES